MATRSLKAQLELSADASGVEAGVTRAQRSLTDLGVTAAAAGRQASTGLASAGDGGDKASAKVDAATRSIAGSIQRTTAVLEAGGRGTSAYFKALASQRGIDPEALKPYLDQLDAVAAKQKLASQTIGAGAKPLQQYGLSANATAAALRQLPAQFTDILTSLQGGQKPLTVLLQQGGQLKDVFGGIGPAAKAMAGYIAELANPFSIAAAAAAALLYIFDKGESQSAAFARSLILSGNAVGITESEIAQMAKSIGAISGSQGKAADAVAQLAQSGEVAAGSLQRAGQAAAVFESTTGTAIANTVKDFVELGKAPLNASVKLNESMHYLTLSTYSQIKALEDAGRTTDAAKLALTTYADVIEVRGIQMEARLGTIQKLLRGIKDESGKAIDAVLAIGSKSTIQDQVTEAQRLLSELDVRQKLGARNPTTDAAFDKSRVDARARLGQLTRELFLEQSIAGASATAAAQVSARVKFDSAGEQFLTNQAKMEREIVKAKNEGLAAGASTVEIAKREADIRAKYADKGAISAALGIDKSKLTSDLAQFKSANDSLVAIYDNAEKTVEGLRKDGGLSDREYLESKRELLNLQTVAESDFLQKSIDRMKQESISGKDRIDNLRDIGIAVGKLGKISDIAASKSEALEALGDSFRRRREAGYLAEELAARSSIDGMQREYELQLQMATLGEAEGARLAARAQIEEKYRQDRERADANIAIRRKSGVNGKANEDEESDYQKQLGLIDRYSAEALQKFDDNYKARKALDDDYSIGASKAVQSYIDANSNAARLTEEAYTDALGNIENSIANFVRSGKFDFASLADSVISSLIRIEIKAAEVRALTSLKSGGGLLDVIGAAFGFGKGGGTISGAVSPGGDYDIPLIPGRAGGGPVSARGLYQVNERGPELLVAGDKSYLMMGAQGGTVIPNGGAGRDASSPQVINHISVGAGVSRGEVYNIMQSFGQQIKGEILASMRNNGAFSSRG